MEAIVVVDMWERHWCRTAAARMTLLANKMHNALLTARDFNMPIIFAGVEDDPDAFLLPEKKKAPIKPVPEIHVHVTSVPYVICECSGSVCELGGSNKELNKNMVTAPGDYQVHDIDHLYGLCQQRNISKLYYMGAAANMCILHKSYGMIMAHYCLGLKCVLVRDLAIPWLPDYKDNRITGEAQVIRDIEKYLGQTVNRREMIDGLS